MREKELRLALVCCGGVSLAVYMHGITKEIWKLCRASMRRHHPDPETLPPADDSEIVYKALLDALAPALDLTVSTDIIAGASAGGINGILLGQAIATGQSMEPLRTMWLETADSDRMLDPVAASRPLSKLWAMPLIAWTNRRGLGLEEMEEPADRAEAAAKLSRLMRSRWFQPPFSGLTFSGLIHDALVAMADTEATPPLVGPQQPLDLFVTVTDYHGAGVRLVLHSPAEITETEHRLVLGFQSSGADATGQRRLADPVELVFAARATASFPGAFPPFRVDELDALVAARGLDWPGRAGFLARQFPRHGDPAQVTLIDGSVINGRPFGPAIEALAHHRAHREVDRRFVYVDPRPGMHIGPAAGNRLPGFFSTILRSLADIPRQQPINDSLSTIEALSARVRRLRHITEGMAGDVDAAIEAAVGRRFLLFGLSAERLADLRAKGQAAAAVRAGFTYAAYGQLKLARLTEWLAESLSALGAGPIDAVRRALEAGLVAKGLDHVSLAAAQGGGDSDWVTFLRRFDLDFRIRRLRFCVRRINSLSNDSANDGARAVLETVKAGFYEALETHVGRRHPAFLAAHAGLTAAAPLTIATPEASLDALDEALDLRALDGETDQRLAALFTLPMPRPLRRHLLNAYLGFPFYDIVTLALISGDGSDEFDEIKVDRIAPDDARSLAAHGGTRLKGARLSAFGAFFSRGYREHDYLWGRLHAAERLIDIVASAAPADAGLSSERLTALKREAFSAIIQAERPALAAVPDLLAVLAAELGLPDENEG
ncbi:patatin-like protein [Polymorphobacter sp.]|uniref:patatin-like protein n=1 Tax=Polymorphobacter sp. TaxID=1909290 RepID=UPI003F6F6C03